VLKLLLYADDITFFLKDRHDLKNALTLVTYFSKFSGLAMNRNKTEAMWLGSQKHCKEKYYDLKWKLRIKILGIHFCNTLPASEIEENWLPRMETIQRIIVTWSKRNLSIMGKICIVKSLLLSQYIYSMQSLDAPEDILKKINTMLFRFIWKKKYSNTRAFEKVKRKVMCKEYEKGGLNMIDVFDVQKSFLLAWANRLLAEKDEQWKSVPNELFSRLGKSNCCFSSNMKSKVFKGLGYITNSFWKHVLQCWLDNLHNNNSEKSFETPLTEQCLWNNDLIRYKGGCLFLKDWIRSGISLVSDIMDNGNIISLEALCTTVGHKPTRMFEYRAVRTAVEACARKTRVEQGDRWC
jgi:hypothetical protein